MMPVRVLITDDHPLVREGLVSVLDALEDIEIVGSASDGDEAISRIPALRPDVVILDMRMPGDDGATVTGRIKQRFPDVKVLILTGEVEPDGMARAVQAGASGYLLKTTNVMGLRDAIVKVANGESVMAPEATHALFAAMRTPSAGSGSPLSPRELEVLKGMAQGKSNKEIAEALFVSPATAKTHVENVLRKLGAADRAEAVAEGFRRHLIT